MRGQNRGATPTVFPYGRRTTRSSSEGEDSTPANPPTIPINVEVADLPREPDNQAPTMPTLPIFLAKFSGGSGESFKVWVQRLKATIKANKLDDLNQKLLLHSHLDGEAKVFFDSLSEDFEGTPLTDFLQLLENRFSTSKYFDTSILEVQQGKTETVDQYLDRVQRRILGVHIQKDILVSYVIKGLYPSYHLWVRGKDPQSLDEIRQHAKFVEQHHTITPPGASKEEVDNIVVSALAVHTYQQDRLNEQQKHKQYHLSSQGQYYRQYQPFPQEQAYHRQYDQRHPLQSSYNQRPQQQRRPQLPSHQWQKERPDFQDKRGNRRYNNKQIGRDDSSCGNCGKVEKCVPQNTCPYYNFVCQMCNAQGHPTKLCPKHNNQ
ncbi:uncharacterized protein LOC125374621 [Haliotis rufescens]|uniref:uncharacterized protein LOC125374621 n=1 Tax=Haliotis rufescens TaxID=6454 RepID=UPI00201EE990|nr:uncharacterized protein LOC125374621 [Haliotis rufescens]